MTRASALQQAGGRRAGCWVPRTRNRRLARLPKRSRRTVRDAAGREARGRDIAEVGGTCCASRVSDTAEALYVLRCVRPRGRHAAERADRVAGAREKRGSERCLGPRRSQETVHAAWRSRPRLSGSTRGRSRDRGPTPVDTASRCAPLGKPAGRRGIRGTPAETRSEKNTLRDVRSAHRSEPVRHEPTAPHRVGTAVRRALRLGAIVLENRIREQQTSVEWTGVAAGSLPRDPEAPANALGAPRGEAS